jgi:hypothetical protein
VIVFCCVFVPLHCRWPSQLIYGTRSSGLHWSNVEGSHRLDQALAERDRTPGPLSSLEHYLVLIVSDLVALELFLQCCQISVLRVGGAVALYLLRPHTSCGLVGSLSTHVDHL